MRYLELSVAVRPDAAEAVADVLRRYVPAGVSMEAPFEAIDDEGRVAFDAAAAVRLRAWLVDDGDARSTVAKLRRELRTCGDAVVRSLRSRGVKDEAWAESWKRYFPVLRVGRRLVVRPSWRRHRARRDDVVIDLDPGMAFGTGQHETTRMCLEALEERITPGAAVLDVGTGSGILAIAAALLGAARVDALDIDSVAASVAAENVARNGVHEVVRVAQGSVGQPWPFDEPAAQRYDIILANLSSRLVRELSGRLVEALRPGGALVVSGLIAEHEAACVEALVDAGGRMVDVSSDGDWRLLIASC
ncbi:MAG: 50S ribosomal protein L11 methyltransferase [Dehalococcoidia bacterium]